MREGKQERILIQEEKQQERQMQGLGGLQISNNLGVYLNHQHYQQGNSSSSIVSPYYQTNQERGQQGNINQQDQYHGASQERENHSKERVGKRNNNLNANIPTRDRSSERVTFNKSTPHFFSTSSNEQAGYFQAMQSSGNNSINNNINVNNNSSQPSVKDKEKISQIQKIYNNNIRSRHNIHKSQNNFYNTHSNTFFNSSNINGNSNGIITNSNLPNNQITNGILESQSNKKRQITSRQSQSPLVDTQQQQMQQQQQLQSQQYQHQQIQFQQPQYLQHQQPQFGIQKQHQIIKVTQQQQQQSQNSPQLASFQKENSNLANLYSREFKQRTSMNVGKKDILMAPVQTKPGSKNSLHQKPPPQVNNPAAFFSSSNSYSKFYSTEPNFNKKQPKTLYPSYSKQVPIKPQLIPIEDLIVNENLSQSGQVGRKYFSTAAQPMAINSFFSSSTISPSTIFSGSTQKLAALNPSQLGFNQFGKIKLEGVASINQNNPNGFERNLEEDQQQQQLKKGRTLDGQQRILTPKLLVKEDSRQLASLQTQQLYNYEIEIDKPLFSTKKRKDSLLDKEENKGEDKSQQINDATKINNQTQSLSTRQANDKKINNNLTLEVIEEQNKEEEIKNVPQELILQVQKISEARPKTSEGGRRRRGLRQALKDREEKNQKDNIPSKIFEEQMNALKIADSQRREEIEESKQEEILKASPKRLDFSPLKTSCDQEEKAESHERINKNQPYEDKLEGDEEEEDYDDYNQENLGKKNQLFRSQANFYKPANSQSAFHQPQQANFRKTINEGFGIQEDITKSKGYQQQQLSPMANQKQKPKTNNNIYYKGNLPIEVHVKEDDMEYVYEERENKQKFMIKNKKIDTADENKIIIRHNKSATGPKRIPKQQTNEPESEPANTDKNFQHQDDVVERIVVPFKTGLDNEFINLFAIQQPFN